MDGASEQNLVEPLDDPEETNQRKKKSSTLEDDESTDGETDIVNDADASAAKLMSKQKDENDYDDPEQEEVEDAIHDDGSDVDENETNSDLNNVTNELGIKETLTNEFVESYEFDNVNFRWCIVKFSVS